MYLKLSHPRRPLHEVLGRGLQGKYSLELLWGLWFWFTLLPAGIIGMKPSVKPCLLGACLAFGVGTYSCALVEKIGTKNQLEFLASLEASKSSARNRTGPSLYIYI